MFDAVMLAKTVQYVHGHSPYTIPGIPSNTLNGAAQRPTRPGPVCAPSTGAMGPTGRKCALIRSPTCFISSAAAGAL